MAVLFFFVSYHVALYRSRSASQVAELIVHLLGLTAWGPSHFKVSEPHDTERKATYSRVPREIGSHYFIGGVRLTPLLGPTLPALNGR
jgi:hypothetical protein